MKSAAFFGSESTINRVYAQGRREQLESRAHFYPHIVTGATFEEHAPHLSDLEVIFSTWGMPALAEEQIALLPNLKAVFYAAGSVQHFARPFLQRGVAVFSGWMANGIPVAEWTVAQILLANKGYFRAQREMHLAHTSHATFRGRGNFGATVSILGAGVIGRLVVQHLKPFHLQVLVFDPFLPDEVASQLGVQKVSLDEAFRRGDVVSNHIANLPATLGMLMGDHFAVMPRDATFINTGRGATVRESEMIGVLQQRPDLTALLDVTHPEPPVSNSPLWAMENVVLTPHLAGSIGDEVVRMADFVIEEFEAWQSGIPLRFNVTMQMLETMA